jgi:signal transduction histidine kinase
MTTTKLNTTQDHSWSNEQIEYLVHDLRSPLTSILTNLQLLHVKADQPAVTKLVEECRQTAQRMERMILNLLDLGQLESGRLGLQIIDVPLEDLVEEALFLVRPMANARRVALDEQLGACADSLVAVDFDLMTRVLVNLLENAVRHSPQGSPVTIRASREAAGVYCLYVEDEGVGVPEEWKDRIFERFVQRSPSDTSRIGRGLGLAFSKLVSDEHGFDIGVELRASKGSRFYLKLGRE